MFSSFSAEQVAALPSELVVNYGDQILTHLSPEIAQSFPDLSNGNNSLNIEDSDGWGDGSSDDNLIEGLETTSQDSNVPPEENILLLGEENTESSAESPEGGVENNNTTQEATINSAVEAIDQSIAAASDEDSDAFGFEAENEQVGNQQEQGQDNSSIT